MASLQQTKKRLAGIKNIHTMTSAMELVAATKMRKAQETALSSRPYAVTALEMLANVFEGMSEELKMSLSDIPLLSPRPVKKTAVVLMAADRGLAGSFNSCVFRTFEKFMETCETPVVCFVIGQKALDFAKRKGYTIQASFTKYGDVFRVDAMQPLSDALSRGFTEKSFDRVITFSSHFFSAVRQEVLERQLLPVEVKKIRATVDEIIPETGRFSQLRKTVQESRPGRPGDYISEPSPQELYERFIPLLFTMQLYHLILEANASEHSARRLAMKNATDNASDLIGALTLEYNRTRQAVVTREIIEITGTAAAMNT